MEEVTLIPQVEDANARTVLVTNISPQATNKTVSDFFAFCGTISSLTMRTNSEASEKVQEAIIEFSQEAATKTALLLTNALIIDRPINVTRFNGQLPGQADATGENVRVYKESEIDNKPHELPANQRTQTSVVASLIAAGYQLASGTVETAKSYDEQYSVSAQIKDSVDSVVSVVKGVDSQYKITETTSAWYKAASDKITQLDKSYGVSETASAISASAEKVVNDISQNPTVMATSQAVKSTTGAIATYADQLGKDVQKYVEEQPALKAVSDGVKDTVSSVQGVVDETGRLINQEAGKEGVEGTSGGSVVTETSTTTTTIPTNTTTTSSSAPEVNPAAGLGTDAPLEKRD